MKISRSLLLWCKHILVLTLIGSFIRFLFYFFLAPPDLKFSTHSVDILNAFARGFRFDLSALAYITLLFIPFTFFRKTPNFIFKTGLFVHRILLYFWIAINISDILFYSFYTDRFNLIVFGFLDDDTTGLFKIFWKNYPALKITAIVIFLCILAYLSSQKFISQKKIEILNTNWKIKTILVLILVLCARGTLSMFPLGPDYAVISSIPFINHLSYGTGHALMRAAKLRSEQNRLGANSWNSNLNEFGYAPSTPQNEDQAFEDFFNKKIESPVSENSRYNLMKFQTPHEKTNEQIKNVVLVVMESWGGYGFVGSRPPEFDLIGKMRKHLKEDFFNLNFLANTHGTAGSLSCILGGIPQRAISPFLTESSYLNTPLSTSPALTYKKQGFETHFLYGGNPGWRDMNKYALAQGFDFIEGEIEVKKTLKENDIPSAGAHDWGIYDEDLFNYIKIKLNEHPEKNKLYVVMTTTNHPPFELPLHYDESTITHQVQADRYSEGSRLMDKNLAQKRFKTFRYSSDALANFIDLIRSSPLQNSTLVAATGDHSSWLVNFESNEDFTKDAVPFYIYVPVSVRKALNLDKNIFQNNFGGHMDIWPTLYSLSLNHVEYESFGSNMFNKKDLSFALNDSRLIASYEAAVLVHNGKKTSYYIRENNDRNLYSPSEIKNKTHEQLELKYKSLMGALDSYLYHSKTNLK